MTTEHLTPARLALIEKYKMKFDKGISEGSRSVIHIRVLNAYWKNHRQFLDAGIRLVPKKTTSKVIRERGYFEMFNPMIGAKPITKVHNK